MKLSVVILTKNSEADIEKLIHSLRFCDEVLIVDDESTDKTAERAKSLGAQVYSRPLSGDFATQRNFADSRAIGDWILHIDSDEEVNDALAGEIMLKMKNPSVSAYYIKRRDFFWGREVRYGDVWTARSRGFIRLYQKNSGTWEGTVHEKFTTNKQISKLQNAIIHRPHPTIAEFIGEVNHYSTLRARELESQGRRVNIVSVVLYPLLKFIYLYIFRLGILDGSAGFAYTFMMSFHSYLVRAKLYQYLYIDKKGL